MARAEVGDDVFGEDPTVNRLQEVAARLLGRRRALFVPSGTMANQLAVRLHTQPGDEMIVDAGSPTWFATRAEPPRRYRAFRPAGYPASGESLSRNRSRRRSGPADYHNPPTTLICLENTHNRGGGTIYPLATIASDPENRRARGIVMHLDGARLFNAVVATGIPAAEYARSFETVSFCLSKGLGRTGRLIDLR